MAAEGFEEFVAVVDHGSLTAAAQDLGLPRPTLSRRLGRLEERLGVTLLHRTTRRVTLTREGEALYPTARTVVRSARQVEAEVKRLDGVPRGLLRIAVPIEIPHETFALWTTTYLRRYPEVRLEMLATSDATDLLSGGFDLALRSRPDDVPGMVMRTLTVNTLVAVASPAYLDRRGRPHDPRDLRHHDAIVGFQSNGSPVRRWPLLRGGECRVTGRLATNPFGVRLHAAAQGLGITLTLESMAHPMLADGRLERVLPDRVGRQDRACLMWPQSRRRDPRIRTFVDHLVQGLAQARAARQPD